MSSPIAPDSATYSTHSMHMPHTSRALALAALVALAGAACSSASPAIDPRRSAVESTSPLPEGCTTDRPYFEFQVERPAEYLPDRAAAAGTVVPSDRRGDSVSVQFVVDVTGRPEPASVKVIRGEADPLAEAARAAIAEWRYAPARLGRCPVRQLVQTRVRRR